LRLTDTGDRARTPKQLYLTASRRWFNAEKRGVIARTGMTELTTDPAISRGFHSTKKGGNRPNSSSI
jgi:hypothetical protein